MRIHQDPLYIGQICTQKCLEANTSQVFGNCGSLSPPPTLRNRWLLLLALSLLPFALPGSEQYWRFQILHFSLQDCSRGDCWLLILLRQQGKTARPLLLRHWYEIMALYYVKSILTEISASRQDRRVLQKSKIIRIKFLSIWGMLQTSGYV